jgi:uncharacterized protein
MSTAMLILPQRYGGWIQTISGGQFWPLDPRPGEVTIDDIASALSNLCRFGGHVAAGFYSVAQHSVLVALSLPHNLRKQGLLHDAAEAYIVDVPRPIKRHLINYDVAEARLASCIGDRFGVELCALPRAVSLADERALATERRDLLVPAPMPWGEPQGGRLEPWRAKITPWGPVEARKTFMGLALMLGIK